MSESQLLPAAQKMDKDRGVFKMKRKITLWNAVALIVGSVIGSGIFVSPGGVLMYVHSGGTALIIWAVCGLLCTAGALCFCELGTMLPSSGGEYTYILHSFGELPAFLTLWVNVLIIRPGAQAVLALAFSEYALGLTFPNCAGPRSAVVLLAASVLSLLTLINCSSVRLSMKIQTLFTSAKLLAVSVIIIAGLLQLIAGTSNMDNMSVFLPGDSGLNIGGVAMAFYSGLFAYAGWNTVNFVTEELKHPYKNLPRSIWIAVPSVTVIYILVNMAYLTVLSPEQIISSQAVAVLFARETLGILHYGVPVFVALSTFGSLNGLLFTSGRLFLAGARNGHLPPVLSFISLQSKTPTPALLFTCSLSFFMIGFGILFLINCLSFVLWMTIGGATAGLLWLRRTQPDLLRPFKVNLIFPITFISCCLFLVIVPMVTEPRSTGLAILLTVSGIPFYLIGVSWKKKPQVLLKAYYTLEIWLQKILMVVPPEGENTGRHGSPEGEGK